MTEYDLTKGKTNFILVGIASLFGLIVIIIAYYIFAARFNKRSIYQEKSTIKQSNNNSNDNNNNSINSNNSNNTNKSSSVNSINNVSSPGYNPNYFSNNVSTEPQVFSVSENIWTYDDAEAVCKSFDSELATYEQMVEEYKRGGNWCNRGWIKSDNDSLSKETAHPIQKDFYDKMQDNDPERRDDCGETGLNRATWDNTSLTFGVNCYGVKPPPRTHEKVKRQNLSDKDRRLAEQMARVKKMKPNLSLLPFDSQRWSV
tara:strand:+ start:1600 stop:2373 length:774 start_codon:yes stop_codon:yes gene_type:complete